MEYTSIEICAGAGGQAIGLEQAGFEHLALVEIESIACETLRLNRPDWNIINKDVKDFSAEKYKNVDLLAGGVPCPPFSIAGKQLGQLDERDLFPEAIRLVKECDPYNKCSFYCLKISIIFTSSRPTFPVQTPELYGFRQMFNLDVFCSGQIGNGAGNF